MTVEQLPVRGFLVSVGLDPEILVEFQYNPTQLSDKRAVTYTTLSAPGLLMPARQYSQGGDRTLTFTVRIDSVFDGPSDESIRIAKDEDRSITPELNKYRAFLYPQREDWQDATASFVPLYEQEDRFNAPPLARFGFGEGAGLMQPRIIDCVVTDVAITELMFNRNLAPLRADVAVTLVELVPYGDQVMSAVGA
jgi:Contractile injection system tube protein